MCRFDRVPAQPPALDSQCVFQRDVLANINQFIRTDFVYAARFVSGYIYDPALDDDASYYLGMDVSVRVRRRLPVVAGFQTQG